METERVAKDGRRIHVLNTISPIKDDNGTIIGASAIARDITERKIAQAEIRDSEARLAGVVGSAMPGEERLRNKTLWTIMLLY